MVAWGAGLLAWAVLAVMAWLGMTLVDAGRQSRSLGLEVVGGVLVVLAIGVVLVGVWAL